MTTTAGSPQQQLINRIRENFPAELLNKKIWTLWQLETKPGSDKPTKVPYAPRPDGSIAPASSTNPDTWAPFDEVSATLLKSATATATDDGIGCFNDGTYSFIDLDACIVDSEIEPWATTLIHRLGTYTELSPSGNGIHMFLRGSLPGDGKKINGVEMYCRARYFTVTGQPVEISGKAIRDALPGELETLRGEIEANTLRPYQKIGPAKVASTASKGVIITAPMTAVEREAKLNRALSDDLSDYGDDRSAAVYGALQLLARKHDDDEEKMRDEFEASELCASWGHKWERLGEKELAKAVASWESNGKPSWQDKKKWKVRSAAEVKMEQINWLWPGFIARGEIATWTGEVGQGKSLTAFDLGARLSIGTVWPDGTANTNDPCSTLYVSEEESFTHTVKPRWLAAGGDPNRLYNLSWGEAEMLRFETNLSMLSELLDEYNDVRYLIFDPIADYTGKDALDEQQTRKVVTTVKQWAQQRDITVVGILHVNKKNDLRAVQRAAGAKGWVGVPRINNLVGANADGQKYLVTLKTNVHAPVSAGFSTTSAEVVADGITVKTVKAVWNSKAAPVTPDDLLGAPKREQRQERKVDANAAWLKGVLANRKVPAGELRQMARAAGIGERYALDGLLTKVGAKAVREGMPATTLWTIPYGLDQSDLDAIAAGS